MGLDFDIRAGLASRGAGEQTLLEKEAVCTEAARHSTVREHTGPWGLRESLTQVVTWL